MNKLTLNNFIIQNEFPIDYLDRKQLLELINEYCPQTVYINDKPFDGDLLSLELFDDYIIEYRLDKINKLSFFNKEPKEILLINTSKSFTQSNCILKIENYLNWLSEYCNKDLFIKCYDGHYIFRFPQHAYSNLRSIDELYNAINIFRIRLLFSHDNNIFSIIYGYAHADGYWDGSESWSKEVIIKIKISDKVEDVSGYINEGPDDYSWIIKD